MNIPKIVSRKEYLALQTDNSALSEKCNGLENEINNLQSMSKDLVESQAEHNNIVNNLKEDYGKQLADMKAGYEKQISDLTAEIEAEKSSSEDKAIKTLATIGVPADETPMVTTATVSLMEQYQSLSGVKRADFFEKNKAAILKTLREQRGLNH